MSEESLTARIAELEGKIQVQRTELARLHAHNRVRNLELDGLHYVWCSGSCERGIHRFGEHPPLTKEMVELAIQNVERMAQRVSGTEYKKMMSKLSTNTIYWPIRKILKHAWDGMRKQAERAMRAEKELRELKKKAVS